MKAIKHALVTGGAGFVGSHLCEALLRQSFRVTCIDDFSTGKLANLDHILRVPELTVVRGDVIDTITIDGRVDLIFHLASPSSPRDYLHMPMKTLETGSVGTLNVLNLAHRKNARFVFSSSSEVYGQALVQPQAESYPGNLATTHARSIYGEAKRFGEVSAFAHARAYGTDVGVVRIFNAYGGRMRRGDGRAVPTFITQALDRRPVTVTGEGDQTRSFIHISELIEGMLRMAASDHPGPINLGTECEISIESLALEVIRLTGSSSKIKYLPPVPDEPRFRRPDLTLARAVLGWKSEASIEKGLSETISWFQKHRPL
ncbi:GDP-mannose 4,6-dehydratase [Streptomyces sp. NPDC047525]|uniref:NAD-dependent epimerase/dehydratase family protein n=1 Tax=Streptomyces sp. NPDC047525 TaxID=3155264 RepID=UPI0033E4270A